MPRSLVSAASLTLLLMWNCGKESTAVDPVVAVVVTPTIISLGPKEPRQLVATVQLASGDTLQHAAIYWSADNEAVARVSQSGVVTATGDGTVQVRATVAGVSGAAAVVVQNVLRDVIIYLTGEFGQPDEISIVSPDGTARRRLTIDQLGYATLAISPNGRRIAFARLVNGAWGLFLMNADGGAASLLIQREFAGSPAWSPDGSQIAFRSDNDSPVGTYSRIFVINVDGTGLHQVPPDSSHSGDDGPAWSPDGTRIAFTRGGKLQVVNADGTGLTPLPNDEGATSPAWSPDGTRLAYQSQEGDIFVRNADGSNPVQLTTTTVWETAARWSPDSRRLVFERVIGGTQLFIINADGTGEVRLSTGSLASDEGPSWSPLP